MMTNVLPAPHQILTIPQDPFDFGGLVLPGLLDAMCGHGVAAPDIEHLAAAARALTLITPTGHRCCPK